MRKFLFLLIAFAAGLTSCSWVQDDLDDCPTGCRVQLRMAASLSAGLMDATAFADEVNDVTLFVFDEADRYVGSYSERGESLKQSGYLMDVPLRPGRYRMVAWAGTDDTRYELPALAPGVSVLSDLTLCLQRTADGRQDNYLTPLWYGQIADAEVRNHAYTLLEIGMVKDTNTFVVILQDTSGQPLEGDTYTYEIIADNGFMDYANRLLTDTPVSYGAYLTQTAQVDAPADGGEEGAATDGTDAVLSLSVARAELNTLRLMEEQPARFVVTEKQGGRKILDINLTQYLLLTRELYEERVGRKLTDQEYLDYEDHYSIVFFLSPTGNAANPYLCLTLNINGWIVRLNDVHL